VIFEETNVKAVIDGEEQTTTSTIGDDTGISSRDGLSKSDLNRDDIDNDDIDSDGISLYRPQ